jgi:hypothetical protein
MATKQAADGHNVRVTRLALPLRARATFIALLVAPALVLSACGADDAKKPSAEPSVDLPTGNVEVPEGVTLTKAGTALKFGETATVAYEPNSKRNSVLELTVDSVQTGKISDLAAYQLGPDTKKSRPYYAKIRVKNVGTGDLSRSDIPLFAVDSTNALVKPSGFYTPFKKCPSTPLPAGFTAGKSVSTCLVYLVPPGRSLVEMSYRQIQTFEPITWKGTITPAPTKKPTKKPAKKKKADN